MQIIHRAIRDRYASSICLTCHSAIDDIMIMVSNSPHEEWVSTPLIAVLLVQIASQPLSIVRDSDQIDHTCNLLSI